MLVRAPNHLGDLVLALPALEAVPGADILAPRALAPLLTLAPGLIEGGGRIIPFERGAGAFARTARELRRSRYRRGVLLTPSFSSALLFATGGVTERRGTPTDGRRRLLTDPVSLARVSGLHRSVAYWVLATGERPASSPTPRLVIPESARARWEEAAGTRRSRPVIGVFPGGNASSRQWNPERFAELVRRLAGQGVRVVVFGGPGERALAASVAGGVALDLAGRTDIPLLATGLAECDLLVTNDTGPMHLAAAVGTPTVSLWGAGDPTSTGPVGVGHELLRHAELPCVPCLKNECPRRGRGFVLDEAERECLRLIEVATVEDAVLGKLARPTGS